MRSPSRTHNFVCNFLAESQSKTVIYALSTRCNLIVDIAKRLSFDESSLIMPSGLLASPLNCHNCLH